MLLFCRNNKTHPSTLRKASDLEKWNLSCTESATKNITFDIKSDWPKSVVSHCSKIGLVEHITKIITNKFFIWLNLKIGFRTLSEF